MYCTVCHFPVLLLIMLMRLFENIFTSKCIKEKVCKTHFVLEKDFGLTPPIYKDFWLRYDQLLHQACFTFQRNLV